MMQKIIRYVFTFSLILGCASTNYHPPLLLSQREIADYALADGRPLQSGKTYTCKNRDYGIGKDNCTIVLCKDNEKTETKLECEAYVPKSQDNSIARLTKIKNVSETKHGSALAKALIAYEKKDELPLTELCSIEQVICYRNSRFFPSSKINSTSSSTVAGKSRIEMKTKNRAEILDITVYQD